MSALVAAAVSTLMSLWLGPNLTLRQEKVRRGLLARDEIFRALQLLLRHLQKVELQSQADESRGGQAMVNWRIRDYERMLWPVVRTLENPDFPQKVSRHLRPLVQELLGSWRMDYLAICMTDELENALDRYPMQPRHLREPVSVLERLCGHEPGDPALAEEAIAKVESMLKLLR